MDDANSLVIEIWGLKATALGMFPVTGLLLLLGVCFVAAVVAGPARLARMAKRLGKPENE